MIAEPNHLPDEDDPYAPRPAPQWNWRKCVGISLRVFGVSLFVVGGGVHLMANLGFITPPSTVSMSSVSCLGKAGIAA